MLAEVSEFWKYYPYTAEIESIIEEICKVYFNVFEELLVKELSKSLFDIPLYKYIYFEKVYINDLLPEIDIRPLIILDRNNFYRYDIQSVEKYGKFRIFLKQDFLRIEPAAESKFELIDGRIYYKKQDIEYTHIITNKSGIPVKPYIYIYIGQKINDKIVDIYRRFVKSDLPENISELHNIMRGLVFLSVFPKTIENMKSALSLIKGLPYTEYAGKVQKIQDYGDFYILDFLSTYGTLKYYIPGEYILNVKDYYKPMDTLVEAVEIDDTSAINEVVVKW